MHLLALLATILATGFAGLCTSHAQTASTETEMNLRDILVLLEEIGRSAVVECTEDPDTENVFFPEQVEEDERGRLRRLHEYFGEYNWHGNGMFTMTPDNVMAYWYLQLCNFTYNHQKIRTKDPTWQTVAWTWQTRQGVCRDSATLLADMLRAQDYDARLVVGDLLERPGDVPTVDTGHAWVVVRDTSSGKEYLLESTQEMWDSAMRVPPLTSQEPGYIPAMQVTYEDYYTRSGKGWTSSYTDGWYRSPTGNPTCLNSN